MTRKELYKEIVALNLQEEVKKTFGDNYTRVSNIKLQSFIDDVHASLDSEGECCFMRLIEVLAKKKILLKSEVRYITELL